MSAAASVFTLPIAILPDDIDELGHVNNGVYLRWAQEIAIAHWQARATPEMVAGLVWVVRRHEIDYRVQLVAEDVVEARTWVASAPRGALWTRHVAIFKQGMERPVAELKSDWCLLDARTRRVLRVPADLVARFV